MTQKMLNSEREIWMNRHVYYPLIALGTIASIVLAGDIVRTKWNMRQSNKNAALEEKAFEAKYPVIPFTTNDLAGFARYGIVPTNGVITREQVDLLKERIAEENFRLRNQDLYPTYSQPAEPIAPKTNTPAKPKAYTPIPNTNTSTKVPKIKNNNPGNIRAVRRIKWKGQIGSNRGFCVFDSLEHGYKAMAKNLTTYDQKYGRDTIKEIIESWAPRCENNTHGYISEVSIQTGYAPNQELDLKDKKIATNLMVAMTRQEHGKHVPASYISKAIGSHYR